jgi:hypothetical protein
VCFCHTHVRSSLVLFLLICWTCVSLGLVVPHQRTVALHTFATSARQRPAPLTPRPVAGPSRSSSPRASAFHRTPELRPRYGHHVSASCAIAFLRNSSCARRCSAHRTPASPARAHGPALLRLPNTCIHRQLPRVTTRTLAPPAHACRLEPHALRSPSALLARTSGCAHAATACACGYSCARLAATPSHLRASLQCAPFPRACATA